MAVWSFSKWWRVEEVAGYTPVLDREELHVGATSAPTSVLDRCTDRLHDNKPQLAPSLPWLERPSPLRHRPRPSKND